jgi:hypothetical protein
MRKGRLGFDRAFSSWQPRWSRLFLKIDAIERRMLLRSRGEGVITFFRTLFPAKTFWNESEFPAAARCTMPSISYVSSVRGTTMSTRDCAWVKPFFLSMTSGRTPRRVRKPASIAAIVAIESLLRGNARLCQNSIDARRQTALLKKQPVSGGAEPLACQLGVSALSVLHFSFSHFSNVLYVTIMTQRRALVNGQSNVCSWSAELGDGWCSV